MPRYGVLDCACSRSAAAPFEEGDETEEFPKNQLPRLSGGCTVRDQWVKNAGHASPPIEATSQFHAVACQATSAYYHTIERPCQEDMEAVVELACSHKMPDH